MLATVYLQTGKTRFKDRVQAMRSWKNVEEGIYAVYYAETRSRADLLRYLADFWHIVIVYFAVSQ